MAALREPFRLPAARQLIRQILKNGVVIPSKHGLEEMANDDLTLVDCVNVLRGGTVTSCDHIKGSWRYHVRTTPISVIVAFRSETELRIVTAWRNRR
jgi:hypothetical protein